MARRDGAPWRAINVTAEVYDDLLVLRDEISQQRGGRRTSFNDVIRVMVFGEPVVYHKVTIAHEGHGRYTATCSACDWKLGPERGPVIYRQAKEHDTDGLQRRQTVDVMDNRLRV